MLMPAKLGRNDPCFCGSGKKYKKCCIGSDDTDENLQNLVQKPASKRLSMRGETDEYLVHTTTGELFMPARLYYKVHDREKLIASLQKLKCVISDDEKNQYDISYWHEAANIELGCRYDKVPDELFPITLAICYVRGDDEMVVDVRSFERAWRMILFIDRHISREVAEVTDVAIRRAVTIAASHNTEDVLSWDYDEIFTAEKFEESELPEFPELANDATDEEIEARHAVIGDILDKMSNRPIKEVIKMRTFFYEEGIVDIKMRLRIQMTVAMAARKYGFNTMKELMDRMHNDHLVPEDA